MTHFLPLSWWVGDFQNRIDSNLFAYVITVPSPMCDLNISEHGPRYIWDIYLLFGNSFNLQIP